MSRHSPLCNFCGSKLPSELLFTPEEKQRIEAAERKTTERLEQLEAERKKELKARSHVASTILNSQGLHLR